MPFSDAIAKAAAAAPAIEQTPDMVPGRVLGVDGDYLAYSCGGAGDMPWGIALENMHSRVEDMRVQAGAERVVIHMTHTESNKGNRFLYAETLPYQGQRTHSQRPPHWKALRDYIGKLPKAATKERLTQIHVRDREADDSLAWAAHELGHVIAIRDKDLRMVSGLHLDWMDLFLVNVPKDAWEVKDRNGKIYGFKWFCMQMLMGDQADHIPPCMPRKTGEKFAERVLAEASSPATGLSVVQGVYEEFHRGNWHRRFIEQALLLWMRTRKDASPMQFFAKYTPELAEQAEAYIVEKESAPCPND